MTHRRGLQARYQSLCPPLAYQRMAGGWPGAIQSPLSAHTGPCEPVQHCLYALAVPSLPGVGGWEKRNHGLGLVALLVCPLLVCLVAELWSAREL